MAKITYEPMEALREAKRRVASYKYNMSNQKKQRQAGRKTNSKLKYKDVFNNKELDHINQFIKNKIDEINKSNMNHPLLFKGKEYEILDCGISEYMDYQTQIKDNQPISATFVFEAFCHYSMINDPTPLELQIYKKCKKLRFMKPIAESMKDLYEEEL